MAVIGWKDCYETKIQVLDQEHKALVAQINLLYQAIRDKQTEAVLLDIFNRLIDYTTQHFEHEERLMGEYNYPGLAEQRQLHKLLTEQVVAYRGKLQGGEAVSAAEVMGFLRSWLLDHIVEKDIAYGPYLESRGGRFIS